MNTVEERIKAIQNREPEEPTPEDLDAIRAAALEDEASAVPLDRVLSDIEDLEKYSGRFVIRVPRSLHRSLKLAADSEGVSLNQYVLYKLAR